MSDYPAPLTASELISRQTAFEAVFIGFLHRDYIRHMDYCTCSGGGCVFCSGHGWRHTPQSMAFGEGLNAPTASSNPYELKTQYGLHMAFHYGKAARARFEVARIREQLGISEYGEGIA
ncbi:hypothetical protein [Methylovulum psychrotolerans]|uniref:Uncharacterized protein n=1 Tax=Methylovulum psychrotolerans TaxID=1704499 RepID=A0A2S5CRA3_9GAMM|nr:hypothetical protein [Methylovulum psychrotolerans]POZ53306.1 hypothetical protein AADEFJLK_00325 [Methylovulum psychrotolerans]